MIRHEARTGTIRYFTGLSDDRIRKVYTSYFKFDEGAPVKDRRGKSPTQIAPLIQTPERTLESGVFVSLLRANGLLSVEDPPGPTLKGSVDLGHRFCQCYETHLLVVPDLCCRSNGDGICCWASAAETSWESRVARTAR
ncbi:MAG: hypothetical protein VCC36_11245 [Gammaproteobacteria bacterium]